MELDKNVVRIDLGTSVLKVCKEFTPFIAISSFVSLQIPQPGRV